VGSLTQGTTVVALSDDFDFPNEFTWEPIRQTKTYSVTGALLVEVGTRQTGRLITLQGSDTYAWVTRAQLGDLREMAANPAVNMTLLFRGVTYTVRFDYESGAIEARPVADFRDPQPTDYFVVTLRFYEI
jgi:hypothetical protein